MNHMLRNNCLVFLGGGQVGKTCIVKQFLYSEYDEEFRETVEDMYYYEINKHRMVLTGKFLDTAGSIAFPAMQDLYVKNFDAFVLVYSITCQDSFKKMKDIWNNIKTSRKNYRELPCVIVGNKADCENARQVENFEALNWATSEMLGGVFLEVSAKLDHNINKIFEILFEQLNKPRTNMSNSLPVLIKHIEYTALRSDTECPEKRRHKALFCLPLGWRKPRLQLDQTKPKKKKSTNDCKMS